MDSTRFRLYVDLGASQTRKRLKGYGLGVMKIESVDRGRAVVIHTATGEHLRRLKALLADVISKPASEPAAAPPDHPADGESKSGQEPS